MRESTVQSQILEYLKWRGILCTRINAGNILLGRRRVRLAEPGWSDIIGMLPGGRFLAIETKTPEGILRASQILFIGRVRRDGGLAIVADSVEDVEQALKGII